MRNFFDELKPILANNYGIELERITLHAEFFSDLNLSPLELTDFIHFCEQKYKFTLTPLETEEIITLADLIKAIEDHTDEL